MKFSWQMAFVIFLAVVFSLVSWLGRYTLVSGSIGGEGAHSIVYRLDRWTGDVVWIRGANVGVVQIKTD